MNKIGIDAGGSLIKIAYEEDGRLHTKTYPIEESFACMNWLSMLAADTTVTLTGGKGAHLQSMLKQNVQLVDEFQATVAGTRYLLIKEKMVTTDRFIQIHIGTGTSIFHVTPDSYERVLGSGIGGGTLMGLGKLISGTAIFEELLALGTRGNNENSDLLIKDIYEPSPPPLLGSLTAANFGKVHLSENTAIEDHIASLIRMIAETLLLLATQVAKINQLKTLVFTGSMLNGNQPFKELINSFQEMMDFKPLFLDRGAYVGAIGALLDA